MVQSLLVPPLNFCLVAPGIYRSGCPGSKNFDFLRKLHLNSVLYLAEDDYLQDTLDFFTSNVIHVFHIRLEAAKEPFKEYDEAMIQEALEIILDKRNHPILIHCNKGKHRVGVLTAIIRKIMNWSLAATLDEYKRFTGSGTNNKIRMEDHEFIEIYNHKLLRIDPDVAPDWLDEEYWRTTSRDSEMSSMSKKKASEIVVAEKPTSANASEKAIPLPKKDEGLKEPSKDRSSKSPSAKKSKIQENPSAPSSPPPEPRTSITNKKSKGSEIVEVPSSPPPEKDTKKSKGKDPKKEEKPAEIPSKKEEESLEKKADKNSKEKSKDAKTAKPSSAPKSPEPPLEAPKSPTPKDKNDKKGSDPKKDVKPVSPEEPKQSKSSKSNPPSETLPSIKQKEEKKVESKSGASSTPVTLPAIQSNSRTTTPAPKKPKVEKSKDTVKSPKSSAPPSRKSSAKPSVSSPNSKTVKASSSKKSSEQIKKTPSKSSKPTTASSDKSPRTPKVAKKEKPLKKETKGPPTLKDRKPSFKSLEKSLNAPAKEDPAPSKRPDTSKAKVGKKKKSRIPILKQKKTVKQAILIESINANIKNLNNFLNGNTDFLLKGRVSSTGELIPSDIPDDLTTLSRPDLEKNYMLLKNTVTDLEKQLSKERSRARLLPKATTTVPTSLEANIHLRYQYQRALDQERENYNKLQKENQKLVAQMKVLEMKQFKYKKAQSIEEQTAHITEMNVLRNKIKEVENEYDRSIEEHQKTKLALQKEIKEKAKIEKELIMMRRLQMHLSNQLAGRWGTDGGDNIVPSSPFSNDSGSLPTTRNPSAKSVRIVENGKVSKPSHKMENSRLVKPTAASAGRVAALEEKRAAKLKDLRKGRKKRASSKASSKSSNPSTAPTSDDESRKTSEEDRDEEDSQVEETEQDEEAIGGTDDNEEEEDQAESEAATGASETEEEQEEESLKKKSHSRKK